MRRKWLPSATLALALALAARPSHVLVHDSSHFKGLSAFALWETTDATGCIVTDALAAPVENRSPGADGSGGAAVTIGFFVYDQCRFLELVAAEAFVDLGAGDFRANDSLTSATLDATVQLFDAVSSTTIPVTLALTWSIGSAVCRDGSPHRLLSGCSSTVCRQNSSPGHAAASGPFVVVADNHTNDVDATDGPFAEVGVFVVDECHFTQILAAQTAVVLGAGDFRANNSLNAATLNVTVQLYDEVSSTTVPVTLALSWSGIGDVRRESSYLHTRGVGSSLRFRSRGSQREATVTGTFLVGTTNRSEERR